MSVIQRYINMIGMTTIIWFWTLIVLVNRVGSVRIIYIKNCYAKLMTCRWVGGLVTCRGRRAFCFWGLEGGEGRGVLIGKFHHVRRDLASVA